MTKLIFTSFDKRFNHIDELLRVFKENKWHVPVIKSVYHLFHWPEITLSEDRNKPNKKFLNEKENWGDIELLGVYESQEQRIILYIKSIEKTSVKLLKEYKSTTENNLHDVIDYLTKIVIIHEIGHWIVHTLYPTKQIKPENVKYSNSEEVDFHEGLAQYFTWYIIQKNASLLDIFDKLKNHQSHPYKVFEDFKGNKIEDIISALEICKHFNYQEIDALLKEIKICNELSGDPKRKAAVRIKGEPISDNECDKLIKLIDFEDIYKMFSIDQQYKYRSKKYGREFGI